MRAIALLVLLACATAAPAAGQVRETGYFDASGVQGWRMDTEYWLDAGRVRVVPSNAANYGEGIYCQFEFVRQTFSRARLEQVFGRANALTLFDDMRARGVFVHSASHVEGYAAGDVYPSHLDPAYPALEQHYVLGADRNQNAIDIHVGGSNGVVSLLCRGPARPGLTNTGLVRAARQYMTEMQIQMPPPN